MSLRVVVESTPKRAFASALDWPGWSRAAKTPDDAIEALLSYRDRYAEVTGRAGLRLPRPRAAEVVVVQRLAGNGSTEFGVPGAIADDERDPPTTAELDRLVSLLRAAWATFDSAAEAAAGVRLATGPRGGGRDLEGMVAHVQGAEAAYLGQLGSRAPAGAGMTEIRDAFVSALAAAARGVELPNPRRTRHPWPPRYAVRRSAWHALDHAWEIEDRAA